MLAISVAVAEPAIPMRGKGPKPAISNGFIAASISTHRPMNHKGVTESPVPRRPMNMRTSSIDGGSARKMTRR